MQLKIKKYIYIEPKNLKKKSGKIDYNRKKILDHREYDSIFPSFTIWIIKSDELHQGKKGRVFVM